MLNRKINNHLKDYYRKSSNALLITGARQVGKTYSIREFGKTFKSFIEINFIENPDAVEFITCIGINANVVATIKEACRMYLQCSRKSSNSTRKTLPKQTVHRGDIQLDSAGTQ